MMKPRPMAAVLFACLTLLAPHRARAGSAPAEQPRPILRTYVPRDEFAALLAKRDKPGHLVAVKELKSLLDDDFRRRVSRARGAKEAQDKEAARFPRDLLVDQAEVSVTVSPDLTYARLEVSLALTLHNVKEAAFAIPAKGLLFEEVRLDGEDTLLRPEGEAHRVAVSGEGTHKLVYRAVAPVGTEGYSQLVAAPLPPFPGGVARVKIPGAGLEVRLEPGVDLLKKVDGGVTHVTAGLAGGSAIKVSWYTIARHAPVVPAPGAASDAAAAAGETAPRAPARTAPPVVFAEVCHVAGFTDSKLEGVVDFRFTVYRAPVTSLTVRLPEGLGPVTVVASPEVVAEKVVTAREVKVLLATPSEGELGFALRYKKELELKPGDRSAETVLPEFAPADVAAQTGYVVVNRLANVRLEPQPAPSLELLATTPLPEKFRGYRSADSLFMYKYLGLPARLPVKILRYENEDVLTAVVERQIATTLFARGGGQLTTIDYFIRNEHTEFLKLELPISGEMERVLVDGKRVSASRDEGAGVRIPIKSKAASGPTMVRVQVAFRSERSAGAAARFGGELPRIDLPALKLEWRWLVSRDTVLVHFTAGARTLRARPHTGGSGDWQTYAEQVPDPSELKAYFINEGLVAKRQTLEVVAEGLHPRERLLPMFIFFLFGVLSVGLLSRMLFYGKSARAALLVMAISYLSLSLVADETELTRPFVGGLNLAMWMAVLGLALTGMRETARYVLARFGITLAILALVVPGLAHAGGDFGGGSWFPYLSSSKSYQRKAAEVDANQVKEEEEKRGLANLQNTLNRRSQTLRAKSAMDRSGMSPGQQAQPGQGYGNESNVATGDYQQSDGQSSNGSAPSNNAAPRGIAPATPPAVAAAPPPPRPAEPPQPVLLPPLRVVLPYDDAAAPLAGEGTALVDADELERLEAPKPPPSPSPVAPYGAILRDGKLTARIEGKRAVVTASYRVRVARKGFVTVALPLGAAALDRATVDGEPMLLSAAQEAVLENAKDQPADRKVEMSFTLPVSEHEDQGEFTLTLPQAPLLSLELTIPRPKLMVDLSSGQGTSLREDGGITTVSAVLPPGQVRVRWASRPAMDQLPEEPAASRAAVEEAAPVEGARAQVDGTFHTEYVFADAVLTARTRVQYQIFPPGRESLAMILPRGMELLSVTDAQGKPVADHVHNVKDGKLTIYLPARMSGDQTFEVLQKSVTAEEHALVGKASHAKVGFWPAALADVTRAVGTGAFRVPGANMKLAWTQKLDFIPVNKVAPQLRGAFPTAPQFVWRTPDPSSSDWARSEVVVTRLARSVTRSFKIETARAWTLVTDGGETLTRCLYSVRNTGEQFLTLRLPEAARLESAFVHTKPVTPGRGAVAQEYYIPLVMSKEVAGQVGGEPFDVEVVYTGKLAAPLGHAGSADMQLARPADELDRVTWSVFLPDGYRLSPTEGKFRYAGSGQAPEEVGNDKEVGRASKDYSSESGLEDERESHGERRDQLDHLLEQSDQKADRVAPKRRAKAPLAILPAESSNAGLLPIRVAFPRVGGGTAFQREGTRSSEDLALSFSYCRNKLIDLARAVLEALAFLCCCGFVLAMVQKRPVAGSLLGVLVALGGLLALNSTFPASDSRIVSLWASFFVLMAYGFCKPIRWYTTSAMTVLVIMSGSVAHAQAPSPGTPLVLVPYDEKVGAGPALQSLSVHALVPSEVQQKIKQLADKKPEAGEAPPVPPVPYVVLRGDIEVKVKGGVAALDVTYQVRVLAQGWQRIPLITGDLTVGTAQLGSDPGSVIVEENDAYVQQEMAQNREIVSTLGKSDANIKNLAREITTVLLVKGKGDYTVHFQGEASVAVDAAGAHRLSLSPPVFPQGTLSASFPSCDLNVDGQGIARVEPVEDRASGVTTVKAPLTPARPLVLSWTERAAAGANPSPTPSAPAPDEGGRAPSEASVGPGRSPGQIPGSSSPGEGSTPSSPPRRNEPGELEPLVIARSVSKLTVDDTSLRGDLVYTVTIHRRGVNSLSFLVPAGVNIYEVSGPEIQSPHRERGTRDGRQVIVNFKRRFSGETQFIIRYNRPLKSGKEDRRLELPVPAVRCREAAFESGTLGVEREGGVEVTEIEEKRAGLERIELPRLDPDTLRLLPGQILMAYTFATKEPIWSLVLSVLRHQEVKELQTAVIHSMSAHSSLSDQRLTTRITSQVRNSGCPFLELELPDKATLRRVTVNNRPVSASSDPTEPRRHLIGLEAPPAGEGNHVEQTVEVEYVEALAPLGRSGRRTVGLGVTNLPVIGTGLDWTLELPPGTVFKDVISGVHPGVPRAFLDPLGAVPLARDRTLALHRSTVKMGEALHVEFEYGPPWSQALRLAIAAALGFLMAAWITSGVTWITEGTDGVQRLLLAAIAGGFVIAWESRNPGTGFGFYAGGFVGVVTPVAFRALRVFRRRLAGAGLVLLLAVPFAEVRAQDAEADDAPAAEASAPASDARVKAGAGWLEMGSEVLVPQEKLARRMGTTREWSVLSRQAIEGLLARLVAPGELPPETPPVQPPFAHVILSGTLIGQVRAGDGPPSVAFEATYKVQVYQKGVVRLGIDPHDVAVRAVTLDGKPVATLMDGALVAEAVDAQVPVELAVPDALQIHVAEPGLHTIGVKFAARVDVLKEVHNLQLGVPACPATELDLEIPAREPVVSVVPSTQVNVTVEGEVHRVRTRLKYTQTLFVRWRDRHVPAPRATAAAPEEATVFEVVDDLRYRLLPGLVETTARLAVTVRSGAVSSVAVNVPEGTSVIGVEGSGIERWHMSLTGRGIEVPFHSKMRGTFNVVVRCVSRVVAPRDAVAGAVITQANLPSLVVQNALSQSGVVRLFLPAGEDVREETADRRLTKIDPGEAPCADGAPIGDRVYRSVRPGWKMALHQVRHEDVSTSSTRVSHGEVRVLVPRQGLWIARATYQVENETEQFLKVTLPRSSLLLSCTVDGQPRRPSKEEDSFLVPLAKSEPQGTGLRAFPVVLVYFIGGFAGGELGSLGRVNVHLPVLVLPVDRIRLEIATPRDIFLFGEDPAFISRETSITGVLEGVLSLQRLPDPLEIAGALLGGSMLMRRSEDRSYSRAPAASAPMVQSQAERAAEGSYRRKGRTLQRPARMLAARKAMMRGGTGGGVPASQSEADDDLSPADARTPEPASAEESAKEQQVAGFLEIMKRSGGSTGALPVDIQVLFDGLRVTGYTLLLASPGRTPSVSLQYVSMRWGGAVGGVFFFLLPLCLIVLMLSPGRSRATRVLPLAGLAVSGLVVAALAQWGLDLVGWFVGGIPAGVIAAPFLKLNRSLSDASEE